MFKIQKGFPIAQRSIQEVLVPRARWSMLTSSSFAEQNGRLAIDFGSINLQNCLFSRFDVWIGY